jgi:hypothetical protein
MRVLYIFLVLLSSTFLSFSQVKTDGKNLSYPSNNTGVKYTWDQIFYIDSSSLKPASEMNLVEYSKLKNEINSIESNLKAQQKKEISANPKDPFETTQDYNQRIKNINNKYKQLTTDQTIDLKVKLDNWENYLYMLPSQIKVIFDLNKYNADNGQWNIKLIENNQTYDLNISITPAEARNLWSNVSTLNVFELTRLSDQQLPTILIRYQNQSTFLTLMKLNSKEQSIKKNIVEDSKQSNKYNIVEDSDNDYKVFTKVEVESGYIGGDTAYRRYLQNNLDTEVPESKGAPAGQYTVIVRFIVAKDGSISDVVAETNHGYGMEQESVRAIKKSGKWTPAMQNGRNVIAYKRQPITWVVSE